jgi:hypothetical protein
MAIPVTGSWLKQPFGNGDHIPGSEEQVGFEPTLVEYVT